ncbi:unnamed protein product [Larinioides sclopetarius]|uniref:CRAL-TRIO domain-containing protein n=1 Tax=Larinioides sclopetarius TaxID=280406 RepID=A0AAV2BAZ3_9ARAC
MSQERIEPECYPIHMNFLPDIFRKKAVKELHETPEKSKELDKLKHLLSNDKTTAGIDFEEDFIRLFLRHNKYDVSKAFPYVRNFVNFRRNYSNLFINIPDEHFATKASTRFISVLPYRCPDGCTLILIELGKWNLDEFSLEDVERMAIFTFLQTLRCPMTQINGFKSIIDFKNTSIKYFRYINPSTLYLLYHVAFVVFHSEPESLLNYFPTSILPQQYGGKLNDYHNEDMMRKLNKEHRNFPIGGQPNYF